MINGYVVGDSEVVRRLRAVPVNVRGQVRDAIGRLVLRLQRKVMQQKLTGQVLRVRTGTLRRSIDQVVIADGNAIAGVVSTNVKYGRLHEFGFQGEQVVKAHLRTIKQAWGRPIAAKAVEVRAHARTVDYPARSFLRSSLREMRDEIRVDLDKAVAEGLKQ